MGAHIVDGEFRSDKYEWSRPGFVPLKLTDPMAQKLLWAYAELRREIDAEFADDLQEALRLKGYNPDAPEPSDFAKKLGYLFGEAVKEALKKDDS